MKCYKPPPTAQDRYTSITSGLAIAAYERTILAGQCSRTPGGRRLHRSDPRHAKVQNAATLQHERFALLWSRRFHAQHPAGGGVQNRALPENPNVPVSQLDPYFVPLSRSEQEIADITAFLTKSLHDPKLRRYQPIRVLSGQCFPFDDPLARAQLGCN